MKVVEFPKQNMNDIPLQLRKLADYIESGECKTNHVLAIVSQVEDFPDVYGWGDSTPASAVLLLELAKHWFVTNLVERK